MSLENLITEQLDIWTNAIENRKASGRGSRNKLNLYGINKLRELILELAVRGQLVPQEPSDEPASALLEKIAVEKARLIEEGKIKKQKALPLIKEDEKTFRLPEGWKWVRLKNIGHDWGQTKPKNKFTYIDVGSINKEQGIISTPSVLLPEDAPSRARKIVKKGSVIYSTVRPYLLNIATVNFDIAPKPIASTAFAVIQPYRGISSSFLYHYLRSPLFIKYVENCQTGVAYPAINDKQFFSGIMPLPPEKEQQRIISKVNELMSFCDALEQAQTQHIQAHKKLVDNLLAALTNAANQGDFDQAWGRIAKHFDTLFSTEDSIDQLKQTILQLAVMGKLAPQNPKDEPASVLLEKIAAEKARLIKEKKIKKQKALPPISDKEKPFELPNGWEWCRLVDIFALITDGDHQAPPKSDSGIPFLVIGNLNTGRVIFDDCKYVPTEYYDKLDWGRKPRRSDLLYTVTGSFGISIEIHQNEKFCVQRHVAILKSVLSTPTNYLSQYLKSSYAFNYSFSIATGIAQKTVPLTGLRKMLVAVPPVEEQQRIVRKVNQLAALCDRLKAHLNDQQITQQHLADVLTNPTMENAA